MHQEYFYIYSVLAMNVEKNVRNFVSCKLGSFFIKSITHKQPSCMLFAFAFANRLIFHSLLHSVCRNLNTNKTVKKVSMD